MHMRENLDNNRHRCNLLIGKGILSSFYYFHAYNILFFPVFDAIEEFCSLSKLLLLVRLVNFVYLSPPVWADVPAACYSRNVSPTASDDASSTAGSVSGACHVPTSSTEQLSCRTCRLSYGDQTLFRGMINCFYPLKEKKIVSRSVREEVFAFALACLPSFFFQFCQLIIKKHCAFCVWSESHIQVIMRATLLLFNSFT